MRVRFPSPALLFPSQVRAALLPRRLTGTDAWPRARATYVPYRWPVMSPLAACADLIRLIRGLADKVPRARAMTRSRSLVACWYIIAARTLACGQVDVLAPEPGQLTPSEVRERGQQDQRPVPNRHLAGDREDHRQRDDLPLVRVFFASPVDTARVPPDDAVLVGRRGEDGMQQPVSLRHRY